MVILHIANLSNNKSAGPNTNVPKNIIYGNNYANVGLFNLTRDDPPIKIPNDKYFSSRDYKSISDLPEPFNMPNIVIFQGIYFLKYFTISRFLKKYKIPYVVVPRCSMTEAAQKSKKLKKKIFNILFFNKFINGAAKIQFLTQNEYYESKKCFSFKDYFVCGNGIEIPDNKYRIKHRKEFKVVFIGRINVYHKGLDVLLDSIRDNKTWFIKNNVYLNLYGSNSDNGYEYINRYIKINCLMDIVNLNEAVYGKEKERILLDSDVFIHTSRLEGQPTAVIEAVSYGIPVVVTPGTNIMDIVKENKLGYISNFDKEAVFKTIKKVFEEKKYFNQISKNEIKYAKENFDWNLICEKFVNICEEINRV